MADLQLISDLMRMCNIKIVHSVTEAKAKMPAVVRGASQGERVLIHAHNKPRAVLLGVEDFTTLLAKAKAYDQLISGEAETHIPASIVQESQATSEGK